ncbi:MAG: hypothetical protein ACRDMV_24345 [Streptosporangiales bacterium]
MTRTKDPRRLRSVEAVDGRLTGLASELTSLRGEYAAEVSVLEEIDRLLDQRLLLKDMGTRERADRHSPAA